MMQNRLQYYVAESLQDGIFTAGIVRIHQEAFMNAEGILPIKFGFDKQNGILFKLIRLIQCLLFFIKIPNSSIVYFHFPLQAGIYQLLFRGLSWRKVKTVVLIVDIDGLRDNDEQLLSKEIDQLKRFTILVAHNKAMKKWLIYKIPFAQITTIQLFDYPNINKIVSREFIKSICYAGNIAKATFLYKLHHIKQLKCNVYGSGYDSEMNIKNGFDYKGLFTPAELPAALEGSFGLVWDGHDLDTCDAYLQYNNPHKLSLYLTAGLPVIVWKKSAIANFVLEMKIGFCIHTIKEIPIYLNELSSSEYKIMQQNANEIGLKIQSGTYLKTVLKMIKETN